MLAAVLQLPLLLSCADDSVDETVHFAVYDDSGEIPEFIEIPSNGLSAPAFRVMAGAPWRLSVAEGADWISADPASGPEGVRQLKLDVAPNTGDKARTGRLEFFCAEQRISVLINQKAPDAEEIVPPPAESEVPVADLLDVVFNADGTAVDVSKSARTVVYKKGEALVNYFSEPYGRYVAHYSHELATSMNEGYHEIDYTDDVAFQKALEDGHTMEVVFRMDEAPNGSEIKPFSSMDSGGLGFLITDAKRGKEITYLPNVSTDGKSNWIWARSGVIPEPGRYYHVVGVWDKDRQKASVYIDGKLMNEVPAVGSLNVPGTARKWFCIGGDPGGSKAQCAFNGDVVLARIYDSVLNAKDVSKLHADVSNDVKAELVAVSDPAYLPSANVSKGCWFHIYASGFRSGDVLVLESVADRALSYTCNAVYADESLKFRIPDDFIPGNYCILLRRGNAVLPLGYTDLKLVDKAYIVNKTQIVAHRGYHPGNVPENSIASLVEAQKLKVYGSELDVYITTDGVVVLYHDTTFRGASDHADNEAYKGLRPDSCTYEEIRNYKLCNGELLPTLDQYLEQAKKCPEVKVILEIKSHNSKDKNMRAVQACYEAVKSKGMQDQVEYISGNYDICKKVLEYDPSAIVQVLGSATSVEKYYNDGIKGIDYRHDRLTDSVIRDARNHGMMVNVWTLNTRSAMMEFIGKGVDLITTDEAELGMSLVGKTFVSVE